MSGDICKYSTLLPQDFFQKIFENGPIGMAVVDSDFRYADVNRPFYRIRSQFTRALSDRAELIKQPS